MNDEQRIKELYEKMYRAMIDKDRAVLEKLHDDSFVLTHMTGMRQPKEVYIDSVMNSVLNYYSAKHEDMKVSINGDRAALTGRSLVNAAVFGGGKHNWRLEQDLTLVKRDGKWLITLSEASTY